MVKKLKIKSNFRKVALRRKPYITENENNESDVIKYLTPGNHNTIRRLDEREYYSYTDDVYYRVIVNDVLNGFINKIAFEEDGNGS